MHELDLTIEICGTSGDGTIAAGGLLNAAVARAGFSVMAFDSYPAEIRGFGRCVTRARIGSGEVLGLTDETQVLISLDDSQSLERLPYMSTNALLIFDNNPPSYVSEDRSIAAHVESHIRLMGVPFLDISGNTMGSKRGRNMVALGAFAGVHGVSPDFFHHAIKQKFASKGDGVIDSNLRCFDAGFEFVAAEHADRLRRTLDRVLAPDAGETVLISGNTAIARGALDAGLKLYFGYPITPATPVMEYLARALPEAGGTLVQMEDEIASIGAVLGGYFAGERSMTATSGPGFALMTELIVHGIVAEIPAAIVNVQRGGPSTGLPTKTEQSDLQAVVFGGPGDSARIVLAPSNVAECYEYMIKTFQLAERYQTPVILLTDFFLNSRMESIPLPAPPEEPKASWNLYPDEKEKGDYRRYRITESGISPRAIPGMEGLVFNSTGLEHSEKGNPDYTSVNHTEMTAKRHRKLRGALVDMPPPEEFSTQETMDVGVIAWGSTFGAALEAVRMAQENGKNVGALKITSIFPYHADLIRDFMSRCREILIPELNYEGQLANLIGHLHGKDVVRLNRVTGKPISAAVIAEEVESLLQDIAS